jgi:hypothetical protein
VNPENFCAPQVFFLSERYNLVVMKRPDYLIKENTDEPNPGGLRAAEEESVPRTRGDRAVPPRNDYGKLPQVWKGQLPLCPAGASRTWPSLLVDRDQGRQELWAAVRVGAGTRKDRTRGDQLSALSAVDGTVD